MHIFAHGSILIEFHVQMCKYVQMCMCNVMCTHAHRMLTVILLMSTVFERYFHPGTRFMTQKSLENTLKHHLSQFYGYTNFQT